MSSKKSGLVPLLALTVATATTCLAYFYLQKKKDKFESLDDSSSSKGNAKAAIIEDTQINTQKQDEVQANKNQDELNADSVAPNLASVSTGEDSGSESDAVLKEDIASEPASPTKTQSRADIEGNSLKDAPKQESAKDAANKASTTSLSVDTLTKKSPLKVDSDPAEMPQTVRASPSAIEEFAKGALQALSDEPDPVDQKFSPMKEYAKVALQDQEAKDGTAPAVTTDDGTQSTCVKKELEQASPTIDNTVEITEPATEGVASMPVKGGSPTKDEVELPPNTPDSLPDEAVAETPEKQPDVEKKAGGAESDLWEFLQKEMQQGRRCAGCGKEEGDKKYKPCAKCRGVLYCGKPCQKSHWKQHKKVCCK